jgi:peroxiredoxin
MKTLAAAGSPAPGFRLEALDGKIYSLAELAEQSPVVLVFFKVTCPVCQFTLPFLERIAASSHLRVVAISQDDAKATRAFQDKYGITLLTLLDSAAGGYAVSNAYGISSVPALFVIEPGPVVALAGSGFSKADLEEVGRRAGMPPFRAGESVPAHRPG